MRIGLSVIDLSALARWPDQARASSEIHKALDPLWAMRLWCGRSMLPPAVQVHPLYSRGSLLVVSVGQQPADR